MAISQVTPLTFQGVSAAYLTPTVKSAQTAKTAALATPKAYSVELSGTALAKSLKLEGYSPQMIALKMGLDIKTIYQYLGITAATTTTAATTVKSTYVAPKVSTSTEPKSTYVEPKATYAEPKALTQARDNLTQDLNQLNMAQSTWSDLMKSLTKKTA